jgi:hypothetical protein
MGTDNKSVMVTVYGMPCAMSPRNSKIHILWKFILSNGGGHKWLRNVPSVEPSGFVTIN